jgi:ubiquinone/menaquinone biosynthesis C-methylase UbiE
MLARARRRLSSPGVTFVRCDLREPWPVANESADVVVGNLVLEHIEDCAHVFAEAARVLATGGDAYFAELHPERQRRGGQAQFTDADTGERVRVAAFEHTIDEFGDAAARAGLGVIAFTDHTEAPAAPGAPPRLLVMRLARS